MTTITTKTAEYPWRPDVSVFEPADVLPQAAILQFSTVSGRIEGDQPALRVAYVVDDDAAFVDEGATIDESNPDLNEAVVYTRKFAQLVRLSREQYSQNMTPEQLAASVARAMTAKADNAFLAQAAPVSPAVAPVAGLVNATGIESKTDVATNLDALIDLEATVRNNGAHLETSAWVMSPDCWAGLRKLKQGTASNVSILGAGTEQAQPLLLSIPVYVNAQMPTLTGLLIDRTAVISAVSQLTVAVSDQQYFNSDSIAVRATMRTGHALPRPNRIGKFTLDDGS
ncbi:phage major capsid protein [Mycobacterium talmoniae]|uniref:Major capsid protein n=1 Tax=Mycobacterium talmoniae TaxID=1858794 RepID=A0A1S1NE43_9MYCO|nr:MULTISPECIES: phage major capsid protein [Mycobacterium]OHV03901.1 major capsid protein [Mycobacterium talmoniae]PQM48070.1 hypothetical protein C1Y40_01705 [Mycobacterium talmoniae]TDH51569.1 phage major capsid protein [Mycobacterium eburneum]